MAFCRSYLFAPGNSERLLGKVFSAGADAVVLDLEDSVPAGEKARARERIGEILEDAGLVRGATVYVRINGVEDIPAVVRPALRGVRVPKAESVEQLGAVDRALSEAEARRGLAPGTLTVVATLETARGVLAAFEIARCPRVENLTFGAADFVADLGADPGPEQSETLLARSQLVLASRAAGIDPPVSSVFADLGDDDALRSATEADRRLGFFGRSVIHPRQIAIVHEVFTPRPDALQKAERVVAAYEKAAAAGTGALRTEEGDFVDLAVVRRAQALLSLARRTEPKQEVSPR